MTDTVAIALITSITTAVTTIVGAVVTILTRRKIKQAKDEIQASLRQSASDTLSHDVPVTDYSRVSEKRSSELR